MPEDTSTISGFTQGGFDFGTFIGSVGANLQQWGLQSLNRQTELDQGERPAIKTPSVVTDGQTTTEKIIAYVQNNLLLVIGATLAVVFIWKKLK